MKVGQTWKIAFGIAALGAVAVVGVSPSLRAQAPATPEVTYAKHIAPILQRSCENCHRPGGGGPMPLTSYEEVRPWARAIKQRTGIGPHAGVMPPWYLEKNIGIQKYKDDPSLSAKEVAMVAAWADAGAPRGNPADLPPARTYADANTWRIGTPDLIVKSKNIVVKASHLGLGFNPMALYAIADRLAQREDQWRPFERRGLKRLIYPDAFAL